MSTEPRIALGRVLPSTLYNLIKLKVFANSSLYIALKSPLLRDFGASVTISKLFFWYAVAAVAMTVVFIETSHQFLCVVTFMSILLRWFVTRSVNWNFTCVSIVDSSINRVQPSELLVLSGSSNPY